ncbi:MAG: hypothetical protein PHC29_06005, partial [Candidatus Omnitrophica bacterium]|nr:hypothetical protein [Candidatus Omnitrophota bacterium]
THKGRTLRYRQIAQRSIKEKKLPVIHKAPAQLKDNPWRYFRLAGSNPTKAPEEALAGVL